MGKAYAVRALTRTLGICARETMQSRNVWIDVDNDVMEEVRRRDAAAAAAGRFARTLAPQGGGGGGGKAAQAAAAAAAAGQYEPQVVLPLRLTAAFDHFVFDHFVFDHFVTAAHDRWL